MEAHQTFLNVAVMCIFHAVNHQNGDYGYLITTTYKALFFV